MLVRNALVADPMTTRPETSFPRLVRGLLRGAKNKAAVLDDQGMLVGVIGIHDILRNIVPLYVDLDVKLMEVLHDGYLEQRLMRLQDKTVGDLMTTEIDSIAPDDSLIKAVSIMVKRRRKALPAVEDGRFVGLITRRSILEHVARRTNLCPR